MAATTDQAILGKDLPEPVAFPVASGETIYSGTMVVVGNDGYLYNYDTTAAPTAGIIGIVADGPANSPVAATTANGSISGTNEKQSAVSGDKTVRRVYLSGKFLMTFSSITQAMVGQTMYAVDNNTLDDATDGAAYTKAGTLITYLSATSGYLDLNNFSLADGRKVLHGAMASSTGDAGGVFNVANPMNKVLLISELILDVTTATTAAGTIDAGIAASATSNDALIDGVASSLTGIKSIMINGGTNGGIRKWSASLYVTGTHSAATTSFAGNYAIIYDVWV